MGLCLQPSQPTHIVKLRSRLDFAICIPGRIYFKLNYHIERERAKIDKKKCKNFVKNIFASYDFFVWHICSTFFFPPNIWI